MIALLLGLLLLAGCATRGDSADDGHADGADAFPVTISVAGADPITLETRPERIISLAAPITEMLYAVGAGDRVVAVDDQSNYPADVPASDLSGLTPSPEAIASYDPDLVLVSADVDGLSTALAKTGVATVVLPAPASLADAYAQFEMVGTAVGDRAAGKDLAVSTERRIAEIVADTEGPEQPLSYYHELDQTYYSITSTTFIGEVYSLFGLVNIADANDPDALGGYPQLSPERILHADPDLIFLADTKCCGQDLNTVAARPGWDTLTAVKQGQVVELDDDVASRWGPRVVELAEAIADAVADASTTRG